MPPFPSGTRQQEIVFLFVGTMMKKVAPNGPV
jgi:hypothetical protein